MRRYLLLCSLVPAFAASLTAQSPPLAPGQRIRITAPSAGLNATVAKIESLSTRDISVTWERFRGTRHIEQAEILHRTVPLDSVRSLEVSRGRQSHAGAGLFVGFLVGATAGMIIMQEENEHSFLQPSPALGILMGIPVGVVGALIGSSMATDRWEQVALSGLRVGLMTPTSDRLGIGAVFSF